MNGRRLCLGFTLIELLIALVIVAIIATLALPSYKAYIRRAHRAEALSTINSIQLQEEKYRTYNNTYGTLANVWGGVALTDNGYYSLAITNNTATGYVVTAVAQGDQIGDTQDGTACGTMTLTVNGLTSTRAPAVCWAR